MTVIPGLPGHVSLSFSFRFFSTLILVVPLLGATWSTAEGSENDPEKLFLRGQYFLSKETAASYSQAIEFLERAVSLERSHGGAFAALSFLYWDVARRGWSSRYKLHYTDTAARSKELLREAMNNPSPLAYRVASERASHLKRRPQDALSLAQEAIDLDDTDPAGYLALANAYIKAKEPEKAIDAMRVAMRLNPDHPPSYLRRLGRAQLASKRYAEAAITLESAVRLSPEDEWAMVYLVSAYGHLNKALEAASIVDRIDSLRSTYSKGPLTWENVDTELYISRFPAASGNLGDKVVVRDGLLKAGVVRGFSWIPLVDTVGSSSEVP